MDPYDPYSFQDNKVNVQIKNVKRRSGGSLQNASCVIKSHCSSHKNITIQMPLSSVIERHMAYTSVKYPFLKKSQIKGQTLTLLGLPNCMGRISSIPSKKKSSRKVPWTKRLSVNPLAIFNFSKLLRNFVNTSGKHHEYIKSQICGSNVPTSQVESEADLDLSDIPSLNESKRKSQVANEKVTKKLHATLRRRKLTQQKDIANSIRSHMKKRIICSPKCNSKDNHYAASEIKELYSSDMVQQRISITHLHSITLDNEITINNLHVKTRASNKEMLLFMSPRSTATANACDVTDLSDFDDLSFSDVCIGQYTSDHQSKNINMIKSVNYLSPSFYNDFAEKQLTGIGKSVETSGCFDFTSNNYEPTLATTDILLEKPWRMQSPYIQTCMTSSIEYPVYPEELKVTNIQSHNSLENDEELSISTHLDVDSLSETSSVIRYDLPTDSEEPTLNTIHHSANKDSTYLPILKRNYQPEAVYINTDVEDNLLQQERLEDHSNASVSETLSSSFVNNKKMIPQSQCFTIYDKEKPANAEILPIQYATESDKVSAVTVSMNDSDSPKLSLAVHANYSTPQNHISPVLSKSKRNPPRFMSLLVNNHKNHDATCSDMKTMASPMLSKNKSRKKDLCLKKNSLSTNVTNTNESPQFENTESISVKYNNSPTLCTKISKPSESDAVAPTNCNSNNHEISQIVITEKCATESVIQNNGTSTVVSENKCERNFKVIHTVPSSLHERSNENVRTDLFTKNIKSPVLSKKQYKVKSINVDEVPLVHQETSQLENENKCANKILFQNTTTSLALSKNKIKINNMTEDIISIANNDLKNRKTPRIEHTETCAEGIPCINEIQTEETTNYVDHALCNRSLYLDLVSKPVNSSEGNRTRLSPEKSPFSTSTTAADFIDNFSHLPKAPTPAVNLETLLDNKKDKATANYVYKRNVTNKKYSTELESTGLYTVNSNQNISERTSFSRHVKKVTSKQLVYRGAKQTKVSKDTILHNSHRKESSVIQLIDENTKPENDKVTEKRVSERDVTSKKDSTELECMGFHTVSFDQNIPEKTRESKLSLGKGKKLKSKQLVNRRVKQAKISEGKTLTSYLKESSVIQLFDGNIMFENDKVTEKHVSKEHATNEKDCTDLEYLDFYTVNSDQSMSERTSSRHVKKLTSKQLVYRGAKQTKVSKGTTLHSHLKESSAIQLVDENAKPESDKAIKKHVFKRGATNKKDCAVLTELEYLGSFTVHSDQNVTEEIQDSKICSQHAVTRGAKQAKISEGKTLTSHLPESSAIQLFGKNNASEKNIFTGDITKENSSTELECLGFYKVSSDHNVKEEIRESKSYLEQSKELSSKQLVNCGVKQDKISERKILSNKEPIQFAESFLKNQIQQNRPRKTISVGVNYSRNMPSATSKVSSGIQVNQMSTKQRLPLDQIISNNTTSTDKHKTPATNKFKFLASPGSSGRTYEENTNRNTKQVPIMDTYKPLYKQNSTMLPEHDVIDLRGSSEVSQNLYLGTDSASNKQKIDLANVIMNNNSNNINDEITNTIDVYIDCGFEPEDCASDVKEISFHKITRPASITDIRSTSEFSDMSCINKIANTKFANFVPTPILKTRGQNAAKLNCTQRILTKNKILLQAKDTPKEKYTESYRSNVRGQLLFTSVLKKPKNKKRTLLSEDHVSLQSEETCKDSLVCKSRRTLYFGKQKNAANTEIQPSSTIDPAILPEVDAATKVSRYLIDIGKGNSQNSYLSNMDSISFADTCSQESVQPIRDIRNYVPSEISDSQFLIKLFDSEGENEDEQNNKTNK